MLGVMVTNTTGLLPAGPLDGWKGKGAWDSLPLCCPPWRSSPLHASLSQLLSGLSVHSRSRGIQ